MAASLLPHCALAASFQEDANGFVVMEAEDFDVNVTQDTGQWIFDGTALGFDPYTGWGYMKAFSSGGTDPNTSPHADFTVNFTTTGPHYVWVSGSDAGSKAVHLGLDGVAPATAFDIGGPDGAFGARFGGELVWVGTNNTGGGYNQKAYLNVPSTGQHTVNLFIAAAGLYVDRILLTTDINFEPTPLFGGANSGANVPPETLAPAGILSVAVTQPATAKTLANGSNSVVAVSAKASTSGPAVTKVEFFAKLLPAGADTKIGETTVLPYLIGWTNPPVGNYALKAKVTDAGNNMATSAVVNVTIVAPPPCFTPLISAANNFDSGLGSFTLEVNNHSGGFDFGWSDTANAGGPAGELGGHIVRLNTITPYVAEPLGRRVNRNEEFSFSGTMMFSNVNAQSDIFLGYFDNNSGARVGLKVREATGLTSPFRFSVEPAGFKLGNTLPSLTVAQFDIHWVPSGTGDGSGMVMGTVNGVPFTAPAQGASADSFNVFGLLAPPQGNDDTNGNYYAWFDNLEYSMPASARLAAQLVAPNKVLVSWMLPGAMLQQNDVSIASSNWVNSPASVVQIGSTYYATNMIPPAMRWFRLKRNCE